MSRFQAKLPFVEAPKDYQPQWVVESIWQYQGVNFLAGPPKRARKSSLRRYLTACAIAGEDAFGIFKTQQVRRVLSMIIEDHPGTERNCIERIFEEFGYTKTPQIDFWTPFGFQLDNMTDLHMLLDDIDTEKYDLVTIDPLIEFHNADENSASEISKVAIALRAIAEKCGVAVSHHTAKPPAGVASSTARTLGENMRGSGVLAGIANATIDSSPAGGPNRVKLSFEKKLGIEPEPLEIEIDNDTWVWSPAAKLNEDMVLAVIRATPGCTRDDVVTAVHRRAHDVREIIKSLLHMKLVAEVKKSGRPGALFPC